MEFNLLRISFFFLLNVVYCTYNRDLYAASKVHEDQYKARIVPIESYPYQATVINSDRVFCAGNIIGTKWIVTSARCRGAHMRVYVGSHHGLQGIEYLVNENSSRTHPLYQAEYNNPHYDIMVLELWLTIDFSSTIKPVKLSNRSEDIAEGTIATLTGWGSRQLYERTQFDYLLRKLELPIITYEECKSVVIQTRPEDGYSLPASDDKDILCTKYDGPVIQKCIVSIGAGLVTVVNNEIVLVGISLNSVGCDSHRKRDVYVSILFARQWIYDVSGV